MAKFTSEFKSLGFYVDGKIKEFSNGFYHTTDKKEIEVLERLAGVKKVEEKVEVKVEEVKEVEVTEEPKKPATQTQSKAKTKPSSKK